MLRHAVIAAVMVAALPPGTGGGTVTPRWRSLGKEHYGTLFYDPASVQRKGARVRLTSRVVADAHPAETPLSMVIELEFDCAKPSSTTLSVTRYGAGPNPIERQNVPSDRIEREIVYRNSNVIKLYRVACPRGVPPQDPPTKPTIRVMPRGT